jgi:hypothetical protein
MFVSFRGVPVEVPSAQIAARLRISEIREEAHRRASERVPGGFWTTGLAVVFVALSGQPLGTVSVERAQQIIVDAAAIWSALLAAESAIEAVLADETLTEEQKIAAIDAIYPAWPEA